MREAEGRDGGMASRVGIRKAGHGKGNMVILAEWDDKRALDPRAAHFCRLSCRKAYVAEHYARELAAS